MAPGGPPRSRLREGPSARTRVSCGHSWGNLKPRVAPVRSPSPTPGPRGVSADAPLGLSAPPRRHRVPEPGGGRASGPERRQVARPGPAPSARPLSPCAPGSGSPAWRLRRLLRAAAAARAAMEAGAGAGAGAGAAGWSCPGSGQSRPPLTSPPPLLPLLHLSSLQTPSSSLPPSLSCSHLPVPSSSLHPARHPRPGLHLSGLGLLHTGRILPWPSLAPNPLHPVCPALGAPDPAPTPARRLRAQGEGGVDEVQGENGGEGRGGERLWPRTPLSHARPPITPFPLHAPPHPFNLIFPGSCPRFHPCPSPPCPLLAKETHTLPVCAGRGAWSRGC